MIFKISKTEFVGPFNLKMTLDSDQCPSDIWYFENSKYKTFIKINGKWHPVWICEDRDTLFIETQNNLPREEISKKILYHFWHDYNLLEFYQKYSGDKYISKTIKSSKGLRIMRDLDVNYRIIEAILTQNSSIKQIRNMESNLRKFYGNEHTFNLRKIVNASEKELQQKCKVGYRARYLIAVAKEILNEELNVKQISQIESEKARKLLLKIDGIGPKVADIILLYGFGKPDVFPMDTWLRKALIREYFNNKKISDKRLREFALNYFRKHAGIAHLYMFYYERKIMPPRNSKLLRNFATPCRLSLRSGRLTAINREIPAKFSQIRLRQLLLSARLYMKLC